VRLTGSKKAALFAALPLLLVATIFTISKATDTWSSRRSATNPPGSNQARRSGARSPVATSATGRPTASSAESGGTGAKRPTYKREAAGGIYLDILPANEGDPEGQSNKPISRVTNGVAWAFEPHGVNDGQGDIPFRISRSDGAPINRSVRIVGPNARDFPLHADMCSQQSCGPAGFYCSKAICEFGVTFSPLAIGSRTATLLIGKAAYALSGIGVPIQGEGEERSTPSTSATSTSIAPESTVPPSSTTTMIPSPQRS